MAPVITMGWLPLVLAITPIAAGPSTQREVSQPVPPKQVDRPVVEEKGDFTLYRAGFFADLRPANALEMVQQVPGFAIETGASVRGLEGSASNVLIDGRQPTIKGEPVTALLARIPSTAVIGIMRIRGNHAGYETAGYSDVVNIMRFPRSDTSASLTSEIGLLGSTATHRLEASASRGRPGRNVSASGSILRRDGSQQSMLTRTALPDQRVSSSSNIHANNASLLAELKASPDVTLRFDASRNQTVSTGRETRFALGAAGLRQTVSLDRLSQKASTRGEWRLSPRWTATADLVASATRTRTASELESGGQSSRFFNLARESEVAARVQASWQPSGTWTLDAGVDFARNALESDSALVANDLDVALPAADIRVIEDRAGAFMKLGWRAKTGWSASAQLRLNRAVIIGSRDIAGTRTLWEAKPELIVNGKLGHRTKFEARLARDVDQLTFSSFYASAMLADGVLTVGNPRVDPERRWIAEASFRQTVLKDGQASLTFHAEHIANPIEFVRVAGNFDSATNITSARLARLSGQFSLPLADAGLAGAKLDLGGSWTWSAVSDPLTGEERPLSSKPRWNWTMSVRKDLASAPIAYGASATGSRSGDLYRPAEIDRTITGVQLGGFAEIDLDRSLSLRADVNWSAASQSERLLYAPDRNAGSLSGSEIRRFPALTGVQLTLRASL